MDKKEKHLIGSSTYIFTSALRFLINVAKMQGTEMLLCYITWFVCKTYLVASEALYTKICKSINTQGQAV